MILGVESAALIALAGVAGILVTATVLIALLRRRLPEATHTELVQRVRSWWVMAAVFTVAIVVNEVVSLVFFALVSFLALKEYFSLIPTRRVDRSVIFLAYLTIPAQYAIIGLEWYGIFIIFIPVYVFLLLPFRMVLGGETNHFLRAVGTTQWGLMAMVFGISHVAYLLVLPGELNPGAGGPGLVLFLVFLTQFNDVGQYVWGKTLGRHKVVPQVSPGKTVEGLIGGVVTTLVLAWVLGPWLTPMSHLESLGAGLLIGIGGFAGDVTISALKRDLGVKDTGSLLPGHGGMLDRVDSLIYTAPLFFHYLYFLHYSPTALGLL
ncbi:phosphatidate cytidylyltransferase [Glycomyces buryatensis]|uniref:Phosphatidate cytidylyltransferase n=1 Tax=Glycomyces buryatensis TaxID=2570927 RepID=A0A4S8Q980_9ACTN|nr:phosphatidate cytidylyltransferase [Glycomyces buryatensis]THV40780.1 phosphatidate cytidylyltransferase [Glycomyces buryatensis]